MTTADLSEERSTWDILLLMYTGALGFRLPRETHDQLESFMPHEFDEIDLEIPS